ncbi:MAG: hypothetical protein AAFN00_17015 [Cyanobacteria bacterium J06558_2]
MAMISGRGDYNFSPLHLAVATPSLRQTVRERKRGFFPALTHYLEIKINQTAAQ